MAERIFLIENDERLEPMHERPYDREDILQALLARYPDLIPGDQIDSDAPRRWVLVKREMQVPDSEAAGGRWSLDHLFLDQEGIPTFVETKRSSDTRLRREVLGQMLDYAANSSAYWTVEMMRSVFEQRCLKEEIDVSDELRRVDVTDMDEFWSRVKTNLEAKRLRLIFVADVIPRELRRIIEFLNEQMTTVEVLGVEIRQFVAVDGRRTIVPRVLGQTEKAQQRKSGSTAGVQWTEETFLAKIAERAGNDAANVARRLLRWIDDHGFDVEWNNSERGSFVPVARMNGRNHYPFAVNGRGEVAVWLSWASRKPPFDDDAKLREWVRRLNAVPGSRIDEESPAGHPRVALKALADPKAYDAFIAATEFATREITGK